MTTSTFTQLLSSAALGAVFIFFILALLVVWNQFPFSVRHAQTLSSFKSLIKNIKKHLFSINFELQCAQVSLNSSPVRVICRKCLIVIIMTTTTITTMP